MNETTELFRDLNQARQSEGATRRQAAREDFHSAQLRCGRLGLVLFRHSDAHYSIMDKRAFLPLGGRPSLPCQSGGWRINIYPGNRRIYADTNRQPAPYFRLPRNWSLEDVVTSVIEMVNKENRRQALDMKRKERLTS